MVSKLFDLAEVAEYRRIARVDQIGRRCLANNAFDGILTMIGVVMGSYVGGITDPRIILSTGLATCMAMGVSGGWGAYMAESAERKLEMHDLEQAMLRNLDATKQARASRFAIVVIAMIDGLSPLIAGMSVLLPFIFAGLWNDVLHIYITSLAMAMVALFGLGAFLAKVARESIVRSGLRMILAGLVCVGFSFLLNTKR